MNFFRQSDRYYSGDIFMVHDNADNDPGIENQSRNVFEYRDTPVSKSTTKKSMGSQSSLRSSSAASLKELAAFTSSSPNGEPRKGTPLMSSKKQHKTQLIKGVPQTDV